MLVTDYLLERREQDEVEAIVAHEIGHAKQHHPLIKLGAVLILAVIIGVALAVGSHLVKGVSPGALLLAIPVLLLLGLVLIQGARAGPGAQGRPVRGAAGRGAPDHPSAREARRDQPAQAAHRSALEPPHP